MSLVSTEWLEKNLNNVRIIDASWHMPNSKRNAHSEFLKAHIENTVFFKQFVKGIFFEFCICPLFKPFLGSGV